MRFKQKRLQFAGHYYRADKEKEIISSLILWRPVGRVHSRNLTYPEGIARDLGLDTRHLSSAIANRGDREEISMDVAVHSGGRRMIMMMMMIRKVNYWHYLLDAHWFFNACIAT